MVESWLHVGAPVLVGTGPFQGLDAIVAAGDPASRPGVVRLKIFAHPISLTFPVSAADRHLAPFGDQSPVPQCPHEDVRKQELLSLCPEADVVYQSCFFEWILAAGRLQGWTLSCRGAARR